MYKSKPRHVYKQDTKRLYNGGAADNVGIAINTHGHTE